MESQASDTAQLFLGQALRNVGHFGTGDLEVIVTDTATFEKAKPLLQKSYETA